MVCELGPAAAAALVDAAEAVVVGAGVVVLKRGECVAHLVGNVEPRDRDRDRSDVAAGGGRQRQQ